VIRVNPVNGTHKDVTPGGPRAPTGIAIADDGDLFIADPRCCDDSEAGCSGGIRTPASPGPSRKGI